jgi:hypothetical protein
LAELIDHLPAGAADEPGDGFALSFQAEAGASLTIRADETKRRG